MVDFLVFAALQKEFAPLTKALSAKRIPKTARDAYQYYEATIGTEDGGTYSVVLVCAGGKGAAHSSALLSHAIPRWRPQHVVMTGIAATVPGAGRKLEDVLIASTIVDLSEWKVLPSEDEARAAASDCDFELVSAINAFLDSRAKAKAHIGVIVSQTSLVKSARFRSALVAVARKVTGKKEIVGIEMEGGGLAVGVKTQPSRLRPGFLMIKGAVDFANYHKNDAAQRKAAGLAAKFARDFLAYGPIASRSRDQRAPAPLTGALEVGPTLQTTINTKGDYSPGVVHGNFVVGAGPRRDRPNRKRSGDRTAGSLSTQSG